MTRRDYYRPTVSLRSMPDTDCYASGIHAYLCGSLRMTDRLTYLKPREHNRCDGFGNLLQQTPVKGTPPAMNVPVDATTNRIASTGYQYDANGNLTNLPSGTVYTYDPANRVVSDGGSLSASYNPSNQRVWDGTYLYYYGIRGELLGRYHPTFGATSTWARDGGPTIYFGRKLIRSQGQWVMTDRLGSVRANEGGERFNYYPYGGEITPTPDGRPKFGTYFRDSAGQDYALNRYYGSGLGRFLSPDAGMNGAMPGSPLTWNRYAYVAGDPINRNDPSGRNEDDFYSDEDFEEADVAEPQTGGGGGGGGTSVESTFTPLCADPEQVYGTNGCDKPIYGIFGSGQ